MRRKLAIVTLGVMTAAMLVVSGCGQSANTSEDGGSVNAGEATDVDESEVTAYYESDEVQQESDPEYEDEVSSTVKESLWLLQDDNAQYLEYYEYDNGMAVSYSYEGTYTKDEDVIVFSATSGEVLNITVDNNGKILSVEYAYADSSTKEIAGTYTGLSEKYGSMTLVIEQDSTAELTAEDGTVFDGAIYGDASSWEFLAYDDAGIDSIDWLLTFDGDTFSYQTYENYYYGDCEGTYECTGNLGDITIVVDAEGNASADVTMDGAVRHLEGSVNSISEDASDIGFYMMDESGYILDITVTQLEDGTMNYSGSYTVPLAAG